MSDYYQKCALPKGRTRKQVQARAKRQQRKVVQSVRAQCVERDGHCRYSSDGMLFLFGPCYGRSEWAHLGQKKRARTRGMAPELRHTTKDSLMLCTRHHQMYDSGRMDIVMGPNGADDKIAFVVNTVVGGGEF